MSRFKRLPSSTFSIVESTGLGYLQSLVRRSFGSKTEKRRRDSDNVPTGVRPCLVDSSDGAVVEKADLAERILRGMSITKDFARLVVLVGHGSQTSNNPHAAGLDCGACCGHTGEINVRVVASLLNDHSVRIALRTRGIDLPDSTFVIPALHNTTTDEVELYDLDLVADTHQHDIVTLKESLVKAGDRARIERAPALGLNCTTLTADQLQAQYMARANDWSQTRPEWGLANNAAFIVAPRARTRNINLQGRAFLHEYDYQQDSEGNILELIMTAPMLVTHWINLQYYASTVDNLNYGSGNKVLHNVVGGSIGVFEGNGGDLRIGLSLQSLNDGAQWRHTPLRLCVYIEALEGMIDRVIKKHGVVQQLITNEWIYLFRIDPKTSTVERIYGK